MLWSIFGIMRDTVDGMGILVQEGGVQDVIAISTGQIDKILFNCDYDNISSNGLRKIDVAYNYFLNKCYEEQYCILKKNIIIN